MSEIALIVSVALSSATGAAAGFAMGLVPGLHINNLAAGMTANALATLVAFEALWRLFGCGHVSVAVVCFLVSAMVAHMFSEAIPATYLGLPSEDVVSVLPAHKLARAGLGETAVAASAEGSLAGLTVGILVLLPVCILLGPPGNLYAALKSVMGFVVLFFSALLLASEAMPFVRRRRDWDGAARKLVLAATMFSAAGLIGLIVFRTDYCACEVPKLPWLEDRVVSRSSLLLPLFAGLFGVPTLILSLRAPRLGRHRMSGPRMYSPRPTMRDFALSVLGGVLVGWIPGMTSGSSATLMSPAVRDEVCSIDLDRNARFIWLYSAVSASGAVLAIGALFVISRARSGVMDAVAFFLGESSGTSSFSSWNPLPYALLLSVVLSAVLSFALLSSLRSRIEGVASVLGSSKVAVGSLLFVVALIAVLSGVRGLLLLSTASALGLMPPLLGVRRINLMGCLLVPIALLFLAGA